MPGPNTNTSGYLLRFDCETPLQSVRNSNSWCSRALEGDLQWEAKAERILIVDDDAILGAAKLLLKRRRDQFTRTNSPRQLLGDRGLGV